MKKQMPKTEPPAEVRSQELPINLEALTPQDCARLDTAVMALVEYLVATSSRLA